MWPTGGQSPSILFPVTCPCAQGTAVRPLLRPRPILVCGLAPRTAFLLSGTDSRWRRLFPSFCCLFFSSFSRPGSTWTSTHRAIPNITTSLHDVLAGWHLCISSTAFDIPNSTFMIGDALCVAFAPTRVLGVDDSFDYRRSEARRCEAKGSGRCLPVGKESATSRRRRRR